MNGFVAFEEDRHVRQDVSDESPCDMSNEDIRNDIGELYSEAQDITRQLRDDLENGCQRSADWAFRAQAARRLILKRVDRLRVEAAARGFPEILAERAAEQQANQQRRGAKSADLKRKAENAAQNAENFRLAEERRAEKARRHEELMKTEKGRFIAKAELFVAACAQTLSKDERQRIWARAQEMFPDHPAWTENGGVPAE